MTDRIEPALGAEEWRDVLRDSMLSDGDVITVGRSWIMPDPTADQWIALANAALPDSDPRKITREWVNYLRHLADDCEGEGLNDPDNEWTADAAKLRAFADALASYLPPE